MAKRNKDNGGTATLTEADIEITLDDTGDNMSDTVDETNEGDGGSDETTPTGRPRRKRLHVKNFVGTIVDGNSVPFCITDAASVSEFVAQFGDMGRDWKAAGYETHYNNCGPMQRHGVDRISAQGKAKVIAIFADSLAEDAVASYPPSEAPKNRSAEESNMLLIALHAYIGNLIEAKQNEIAERRLVAAAAAAGVSVEDLRALKSKQSPAAE